MAKRKKKWRPKVRIEYKPLPPEGYEARVQKVIDVLLRELDQAAKDDADRTPPPPLKD